MKLVAHFDGGNSQKYGIGAGAAVLYDEQGNELLVDAQLLTRVTTPIAEYTGLHLAIKLARTYAGVYIAETHVVILGDAELIVRQINGIYRTTKASMEAMCKYAHLLMDPFASCEVREFPKAGPEHKRRFGNVRADELVRECMLAARA